MGRLDAVSDATRPKMSGRAMLSGPSGAGKTWTSLSMAARLAIDEDRADSILVIDTEKESALTYADVFKFRHLPWRPPYDPTELADVLAQLGNQYAVVTIDSFSHFWRGLGGTLDIADGKFGGWKSARPVQERLVEAVLSMPCHVILCVRSKMDYLVTQNSSGKQEIAKVGLAPIQDETLVYEMNVALDIDLEHRITVTKSRTPAVPVGRMYPAGMEAKAADDYAAWLAGGVPPASREEVDSVVSAFAAIVDAELRKAIKAEFVQTFGMPASLTADKVVEAKAWLAARVDGNDEVSLDEIAGADDEIPDTDLVDQLEQDQIDDGVMIPPPGPDAAGGDGGTDATPDAQETTSGEPGADPGTVDHDTPGGFRSFDDVWAHVKPMGRATLCAELTAAGVGLTDEEAQEPGAKGLDKLRKALAVVIARPLGLLPVAVAEESGTLAL